MIAVLKQGTTPDQRDHLVDWLKGMNLDVHVSEGQEVTVLGLVGDTSRVDMDLLRSLEIVAGVKRVSEPFKQANRKFHPKDTIIEIGDARIGGGYDIVLANIVADVIIGLAPIARSLLAPGGVFLCSGIIDNRAEEVAEHLRAAGLEITETRSAEGWFAYTCK